MKTSGICSQYSRNGKTELTGSDANCMACLTRLIQEVRNSHSDRHQIVPIPVFFSCGTDYNTSVKPLISIIIPNRDSARTIGTCLGSIAPDLEQQVEIIVVDDASTDNSAEIIGAFPVRLIRLERHSGASAARNTGARNSLGEALFFIDADCVLQKDTLACVRRAWERHGPDAVVGGTYAREPYDTGFFNMFQAVFVNYFETKRADAPDYIAAHAFLITSELFRKSGGFPEDFLPIIEDVEFSHRLRRAGYRLIMDPAIQVKHIFNFNLARSLRNAFRKSRYWTRYSLEHRDLLADSGTASRELKMNVASCLLCLVLLIMWIATSKVFFLCLLFVIVGLNGIVNRGLIRHFADTKGAFFAALAHTYYTTLYALTVGAGALLGIMEFYFQ
jgi:GT2 family glycosyltransferase